jgi:predicted alpha-1,6-mannanase (GH76 family)
MDVPLAPHFLEWYSSLHRTAVRTFPQTAGTLILIATLCATGTARAGFAPIPLSAGSFNESMIVPASSPAPVIPGGYTTASMDAGLANTGTSWYEQSYNTSAPTTGLPHPGAILTSQSLPNHSYVMAPSYTANNAVMLDSTLTNATLVLASPAAYGGLSLLESGGNNGVSFTYTVHHQNGAVDSGSASIPDWYNGSNPAWTANGRVDVQAFTFSSVNGNDPRLYSLDLTLVNSSSPVTSITFTYLSGTGHGAILAVSGLHGAACTPLAVSGYNEDIIVEAGAGKPGSLDVTTATMDGVNTWYELGYDPDAPATGLPHAGTIVTNLSAPDHLYLMPPTYTANDAVLISSNIPSATLTPATVPPAYPALSFLVSCGDGPVTLGCFIHHADGTVETNSLIAPDWIAWSPVAFVANGRVDVNNISLNYINSGNVRLYSQDIALADSNSPVTSITLTFPANGGAANAVVFALSGGAPVLGLAGDDFNANTAAAAQVLQQWYNGSRLYNSTGWWNAANCLEAIENDICANGDFQYLPVLTNTFAQNASGNFLNGYYDDEGWWANAWIRAFDLTGNTNFLNMAKTIFNDLTNGWDTTTAGCSGGVWWNKTHTYKNAIPNELFLLAAIRLHQRTPGDTGPLSYFYWATNEWAWFKASGMINAENLINDGLNGCQNNGETTWTYNQGVILAGLTDLYKVTGNSAYLSQAELIANAALAYLVDDNGVLVEPCEPGNCGGDGPQFKGIFVRYLAYLYDEARLGNYYNFLYKNAHAVWFNDRNAFNQLGLRWDGPWDSDDAARQSSALMPVSALAEPITTNLLFAKGAGDPAFGHSVGSAVASLAWACGSATPAGYMLTGPRVMYLPVGPHGVHFRAAVNTLSPSAANLAQFSVVEENGGKTLASAGAPWNAFAQAGVARDFVLLFTNTTAANPLDFQVFWNDALSAPSFTLTDITMDGLENWAAANLAHGVGRLDGLNGWEADPVRDTASGYLVEGPGIGGIASGDYTVGFELKVDNFNLDQSPVAVISVVNVDTQTVLASENLTRNQFSNTLYQTFSLGFNAVAGAHYDFRTWWNFSPAAPRLTQRSVMLRPGPVPFFAAVSGTSAVTMNLIGTPDGTLTVQRATHLISGPWLPIGTVTVPAYLGSVQFTDPAPSATSFYRLVLP